MQRKCFDFIVAMIYNACDGCKRSGGTQTYFTESDHNLRSMRNRIDDGFRIIILTALTTFCLSRDVRKAVFFAKTKAQLNGA